MTSRELVIQTLTFQNPPRAPRHNWPYVGDGWFREPELIELQKVWPTDFHSPDRRWGESPYSRPRTADVGTFVDAFGSVWQTAEIGISGEVKRPVLADWSRLDTYKLPWNMVKGADFSTVNPDCAATDKFCRAGAMARPFERMQQMRGVESLFMDLAYGVSEVYKLRDMLHEFFMADMELIVNTDVDAVLFMDDWGTQNALLIHPDMWRSFYKPLYKDYCDLIHSHGKFVFMHSDGNIEAIFPDLIEIGVNAVNSQLFCMDIEGVLTKYKGKITFDGEIDRQHVLPFGTTDDVRAAVRRVRRALDDGRGGVIAECEWGKVDPAENIFAVFDEWNKPLEECLAGK